MKAKMGMEVQAQVYTRSDLMAILQCSATKLWRLEKAAALPRANRSLGAPRWNKSEIDSMFA